MGIVSLRVPNGNSEIFGGCPLCGCADNIWNIGREHWSVCHRHKTKWHIGSNLFSSWKDESEQDWLRNEYRLATYRTVKPVLVESHREAQPTDEPCPF
jgi:hypothetical protein